MACTSSGNSGQFPAGMRVLVVDDDVVCLRLLEKLLRNCMYNVTCCSQATLALNLLRERKGCFDVVLSDVHMPDMDGFKLLELVGLEMGLPVIMMSADGRTNLVMRGIKHGACDYLIKPIRVEELKNIWQHVVRKRWNEIKEHDHLGHADDHDRQKRANDDAEHTSCASEGADEALKVPKKRRDSKYEDDEELESDDPMAAKKPRVVWSVELHQQFVSAVNQLGIDKAVPKRILELMNVPGLTRENVASHLQKFRLYLKRLSGVAHLQADLPPYCGTVEQNLKLASLGRFDIPALTALQAELLAQPAENLILPTMDQRTLLLHTPLQRHKDIPTEQNVSYGQPVITKQASQPLTSNSSDMLINFVQQKQATVQEPSRPVSVQPSCVVVPYQHSPTNPNCGFRNSVVDCGNHMLQPNNSPGPVSNVSSCSGNVHDIAGTRVPSSASVDGAFQFPSLSCMRGSYNGKQYPPQGSTTNSLHVDTGISIPSRFAVDEHEFMVSNISQMRLYGQNNGSKVKQEPNTDLMERGRVGIECRSTFPQMI